MLSFNPEYASWFGKMITDPGVILPVSKDVVLFGSRGQSDVGIMTLDPHDLDIKITSKRIGVEERLAQYNTLPMDFTRAMEKELNNSRNMKESIFTGIFLDTGSAIFEDNMFNGGGSALRLIRSPALNSAVFSSKNYIIKQLPTITKSLRRSQARDKQVDKTREKIVVDSFSILSAIAAQVMHLTDGEMTYVPDGHCVNVVMSETNASSIYLIINDPTGSGWKIMPNNFNKTLEMRDGVIDRVETLVEFACKCVASSLIKRGMDLVDMQRTIRSMDFLPPASSTSNNTPRVAIMTSGSSTTTGIGSLSILAEDGSTHHQIKLSEYRTGLSITENNREVSFTVEPSIDGVQAEHPLSPSILQWLPPLVKRPEVVAAAAAAVVEEENGDNKPSDKDNEDKYSDTDFWSNVPVTPLITPKKWRACKINDRAMISSWKNNLVKLHKYDWTNKTTKVDYFDKMAAFVALMTFRKFQDILADNYVPPQTPSQGSEYAVTMSNVATLFTDVYGFESNGNKPLFALEQLENETGIESIYVLNIIGNSPDGNSVRVVRLEKEMSFLLKAKQYFTEMAIPPINEKCKWTDKAPSSVKEYKYFCDLTAPISKRPRKDNNDGGVEHSALTYTPRCIYHTERCLVHLYSEPEKITEHVSFNKDLNILEIGKNITNQYQTNYKSIFEIVDVPIIVASMSSTKTMTVNNYIISTPSTTTKFVQDPPKTGKQLLAVEEVRNFKLKSVLVPPPYFRDNKRNTTLCSQITEQNCPSSSEGGRFSCPSESLILKYSNLSKKRALEEIAPETETSILSLAM
ncbi:envelope and capsid protein [White spot syndrome virus]|uniref:Envelope and capsid protein n=1 Tax=White spot syndrome virus TaxID=342409 RepID=A0A2U8T4W1_9VIRU|nr:envelope and capsid protein [White spot syndrome virus]